MAHLFVARSFNRLRSLTRTRSQSWLSAVKKSPPSLESAVALAEKEDGLAVRRDPFYWMLRDENLATVCQYIDKERRFAESKRPDVRLKEISTERQLANPLRTNRIIDLDYWDPMFWELNGYYYCFKDEGLLFERVKIMDQAEGTHVETRYPLFHQDDFADFLKLADSKELRIRKQLLFSPCGKFAMVVGDFSHGLSSAVAVLSLAEGLLPHQRIALVTTGIRDVVWCGSSHIIYTVPGARGEASNEVRCLNLWALTDNRSTYQPLHDGSRGELLYKERNHRYSVTLKTTRSDRYVTIKCQSQRSSEVRLVDSHAESLHLQLVWPRTPGLEYSIDHYQDKLYALSNTEVAGEYKLLRLDDSVDCSADRSRWSLFVDSSSDYFIKDVTFHGAHCVLTMRSSNAQPYLHLVPLEHGFADCLDHPYEQRIYPDAACTSLALSCNPSADTPRLGFEQSGPGTPTYLSYMNPVSGQLKSVSAWYWFEACTKDGNLPVATTSRVKAVCPVDGVDIPITLVYREEVKFYRMIVHVYDDLTQPIDMQYYHHWHHLINKGWVLAFCHVRGSRDLGRQWFLDGSGDNKEKSFRDLKTCVEYLHLAGFSRPDHTALYGFGAGGMLVAGLAQREPTLFRAAVLHSPFVDVLREYADGLENPDWAPSQRLQDCDDAVLSEDSLEKITSYCPYTNLVEQSYPDMLITTTRQNTVVPVVGVARYVAKLRSLQEPWVFEDGKESHSAIWFNVLESSEHEPYRTVSRHILDDRQPLAAEIVFLERAL